MRHSCQHDLDHDLARQERLVQDGLAELREGLQRELPLDERLDLVAEEHELESLLARIEERRFQLAGGSPRPQ